MQEEGRKMQMLPKRLFSAALALFLLFVGGGAMAEKQAWEKMQLPPGDIPFIELGEDSDVYLIKQGDDEVAVRSQPKAGAKLRYHWRRFALRAVDYQEEEAWHKVALPGGEGYVQGRFTQLLPAQLRPRLRVHSGTSSMGYVYVASTGQVPLVADISLGDKHHQLLLPNDGEWQPLLLTFGPGKYTLAVYEAGLYDRPIRLLYKCDFSMEQAPADTELALFSSLHTNMAENPVTVALALSLCRDATTDEQKVRALWDWLMTHASYDKALAKGIQFSEIPDGDGIVKGDKGICSDYAAFMAVGLRAVGVPCKHVYGKNKRTGNQHAWNQVYLNGRWQIIDVTMAQSRGPKKFHTEETKNYGAEKGLWDGYH
jgi:hypothetical protein